jgi:hypothetical protein
VKLTKLLHFCNISNFNIDCTYGSNHQSILPWCGYTTPRTCRSRSASELGPGPHRSGDIADQLKRAVSSLGPTRSSLIGKGMIWSPNHGDTAFTVSLFDEFMKRIMPGGNWTKF